MLRLLLAVLALLSPAALFADDASPHEHRAPRAHEAWVPLAFDLPASDAWASIPVTATTDAVLDVRVRGPEVDPAQTHHAMMFLTPIEGDERFGGFGAGWGESYALAQVNVDGERLECCSALYGPFVGSAGGADTSEVEGLALRAGETAWLTLIVANTDATTRASGEMLVREGEVVVGQARSGEDVSYVDLVDEAYLQGASVQVLGATLGKAGIAARAWEPAKNGLMFLHYWAHGGASATLSAQANGETVLDRARTPADEPGMVFAMGPGDFSVELRDLDEGQGLPLYGDDARMSAMALFADLDVPGFGVVVYPDEGEHPEHDHP